MPEIELLLAAPRGFCAGVRRAIDAVSDAIDRHGAPVYVRRPIVHNLAVVRRLEAQGAIFVEELDQVPRGAVVLLSAHGVAPAVAEEAKARGLVVYDAVCPLVAKVHREVERHRRDGRHVLLIGHSGHPEIEGTLGRLPADRATLVGSISDVEKLNIGADQPAAYAVQTTYSVDDAAAIISSLSARFSDLAAPPASDICYATTNRQAAIRTIAARADAVIVVGERFSSNANRLAEVAATHCGSVQLVAQASELEWSRLPVNGTIGVTAAASAPEESVTEILASLADRRRLRIREVSVTDESISFRRVNIG
ncbi:4-hydroxy-3-methylbut-2-enyl diphosphate reductase [Sphingomonas sp. DBB INV C78]|uniref:4-hydroxy-3-methylbut-2-enyl diphosphate reductase n=1 Tax=Sphingomonas sp. DBB INV C78 TaxID=3349434 RepID=UPI0036D2DD13